MGIGDLGCDTPDYQHAWEWIAEGHKRCRVCRREEMDRSQAAAAAPPTLPPVKRKLRLVSETSVPTAKHLISLIARGEHTHDQIVEACRLWVRLAEQDEMLAAGTHYLDANGSLQPKPTQ